MKTGKLPTLSEAQLHSFAPDACGQPMTSPLSRFLLLTRLSAGCRGIPARVPGAPLPPPPPLTWMLAGLFFPIFPPPSLPVWHFLPFLKHSFPEAPPAWLRALAVPGGGAIGTGWNRLEPAVSCTGQPRPLLREVPCSPRCQYLARDTQNNMFLHYIAKVTPAAAIITEGRAANKEPRSSKPLRLSPIEQELCGLVKS